MVDFSTLDTQKQRTVLDHTIQLRALVGELARLIVKARPVELAFIGTVSSLVSSLDFGCMIPDVSGMPGADETRVTGLSGAQPLSREEILAFGGHISAILAAFDTPEMRALAVKTVGPGNTV